MERIQEKGNGEASGAPEKERIQEKGNGEASGRAQNGANPRKGERRSEWPCPKRSEAKKKGTAKRVAVPKMERIQEKGNGEASGRARNGAKPRKRERRSEWPCPKWRQPKKKGTAKRVAVPEMERTQEKGNSEACGRARNGGNPRKRERRSEWPCPKWRESKKKGTAKRVAVPEMERTQEKGGQYSSWLVLIIG
ncbi:hypothetical protein J14TS2_30410 [Bacillus sp. J14TS2]|nr:hypothetical protein J14TS2_30410 [Bacillus sp. J14TS2]